MNEHNLANNNNIHISPAEKIGFIRGFFDFWEKLSQDEQQLIINNSFWTIFKKGQRVHGGESDCIGVLLIRSGSLRVYILSEYGREVTLYRLRAGDVCIFSASCILRDITFEVHIDAEEDCEVLVINATIFERICASNIYAENFSYRITTERFSDVMWAMQQILFMSFDKRLAIFLLDEISRTGSDTIHFTHEQIARYVGSAREVVSRMLKHFENEGLVELSRGSIKVTDKKKLKSLI